MRKQQLLLATLLLLLVCPLSIGQTIQKLDSRLIKDWDEAHYYYNKLGLIDSTHLYLDDYDVYETYRKYTYNEQGLCVREDDYQLMEDGFVHVSYIDYFYNEKKQLVKRLNYNSFGGATFEVGGELKWTYNADGKIATLETSLPSWDNPEEWELYTREIYSYNDDKSLKLIEVHTVPFGGSVDNMYVSSTSDYVYNDKKQLTQDIHKFYYEDSGTEPASTSRNTYEYDEAGNMTVYNSFIGLKSETPQVRYIYHYDLNTLSKNVIYPYNIEDKPAIHLIAASMSPNQIQYEEWWQVPNETDQLEHIENYTWNYSEFNGSGIPENVIDVNRTSYYVHNNTLYFIKLKPGTSIQIYDINGAPVIQQSYNGNGISLENLSRGAYIGKIGNLRMPIKFIR